MSKYEVTLSYSKWHTITVEAKNEEEAESEAWDILHTVGTEVFRETGGDWEEGAYVEELDEESN